MLCISFGIPQITFVSAGYLYMFNPSLDAAAPITNSRHPLRRQRPSRGYEFFLFPFVIPGLFFYCHSGLVFLLSFRACFFTVIPGLIRNPDN